VPIEVISQRLGHADPATAAEITAAAIFGDS